MHALLIISHGSRRVASNQEVNRLAETIALNAAADFGQVGCSFLELCAPSVTDAIDGLAENGADQITVFPHFLAAGTHVANDIPRLIAEAHQMHPQIVFKILPHLGGLDGLSSLILRAIK